jgi:hypothetical protein
MSVQSCSKGNLLSLLLSRCSEIARVISTAATTADTADEIHLIDSATPPHIYIYKETPSQYCETCCTCLSSVETEL